MRPDKRERRPVGPSGAQICQLGGDSGKNISEVPERQYAGAEVVRLRRCLFRKIVIERLPNGSWRGRIVGFDPRFFSKATSREYPTRPRAIEAAKAASRICGLPFICVETLIASCQQGDAA